MRRRMTAAALIAGALMMFGPGMAQAAEPSSSLTCVRIPPIQIGLCY